MKFKILIIHLLFFVFTYAQNKKIVDTSKVACDCENAKSYSINSNLFISQTNAPKGFGVQEIKRSKISDVNLFDAEHHSSWYKFKFLIKGNLCFSILPKDTSQDIDFMLYKSSSENFCDNVSNKKPVTVNLANTDKTKKGETGLNTNSKNNYVDKGNKTPYCSCIEIDSGEIYYLVLDNLSPKPDAYQLNLKFEQKVKLTGVFVDSAGNGLRAEVSLSGSNGREIKKVKTDEKGRYNIDTTINQLNNYLLSAYSKDHFSYSKLILLTKDNIIRDTTILLPSLKPGGKYTIGSINFYGGSPQYIDYAKPALSNLLRMLLENSEMKIKIIGHVNGCTDDANYIKKLSVSRASSIKTFLVDNKIKSKRIEIEGRGCLEMLYSTPKNFLEEEANRRVEIQILSK